jgi:hypothetical protein
VAQDIQGGQLLRERVVQAAAAAMIQLLVAAHQELIQMWAERDLATHRERVVVVAAQQRQVETRIQVRVEMVDKDLLLHLLIRI